MAVAPIKFTVPAVPVAQPRIKTTIRGGHAAVYTPTTKKSKDGTKSPHPILLFKASLKHTAAAAYTDAPLQGPVRVDIVAVFPRTAGQIWKRRPMPRLWHFKKPDRDNLEKAVLDALKGITFADDCQVCAGEVTKFVASGDEQPHVEIRITPLDEGGELQLFG